MRSSSPLRSPAIAKGLASARAGFASLGHSPALAAALSFLLPGLGQAAVGAYRRAVLVAMPAIALGVAVVALALFDRSAFYQVLSSQVLTSLLILDIVTLAYHLWAMLDAYLMARRLHPVRVGAGASRWVSVAAVVVLVAGTMGIHGWPAAVIVQSQQVLGCTWSPNGPCIPDLAPGETLPALTDDPGLEETPDAIPSGWVAGGLVVLDPDQTAGGASSSPTATSGATSVPYSTPPPYTGDPSDWAGDGKLNVLLIGGDAGLGRGGNGAGKPINLRTDTMILLQVDLATGRSAMYGIPRNLYNAPLGAQAWNAYSCHCFPKSKGYYYGLWLDAVNNPKKYPYSGNYFARGTKAIEDSVGSLLGVHVDGAVVVDLLGFVNLIDAMAPNGLHITTPYRVRQMPCAVYNGKYQCFPYSKPDGSGNLYGLDFPKGAQTMNGLNALAYARMRHVVGYDSDYYRMQRQQLVLKAVRDQLNPCELAPRIPSLLTAIQGTIWTDMPQSDAPQLAALASKISTSNIRSYSLTPSAGFAIDVSGSGVLKRYRHIVQIGLDGLPSAYSGGSSSGVGGFHC